MPIAVKKLSTVRLLAAILLLIITQLPYTWLYPLGAEQDKPPQPKWTEYYQQAQVIAGDFLQVCQFMPDDLKGKIVVTNTTTAKNVEELKKRNLHILVTVTPRLEGRSFGTNVMEATLLALMDKPQSEVTEADFVDLIERIPLEPNIEVLNWDALTGAGIDRFFRHTRTDRLSKPVRLALDSLLFLRIIKPNN